MSDTNIEGVRARLRQLQEQVVDTLTLADALQLTVVALHLDTARCELVDEMERYQLHGDVIDMSAPND